MALKPMKELLEIAQQNNSAVAMFNVLSLEMLKGILSAAEAEKTPVILAMAEVHLPYGGLDLWAPILIREADRASVPVAVHLDHGLNIQVIEQALKLGFTSIMYDGSTLSYEENVANTRLVVELAKPYGATIEAELGHVGGGEGGTEDDHEEMYTSPEQAVDFIKATGIDALAVAIGTVHGVYKKKPQLDLERLDEINKSVAHVPLVLHGGSGLSDADFLNCIDRGIAKINICTDLFHASIEGLNDGLQQGLPYPELCKQAEQYVYKAALRKIRLFQNNTVQPA